MSAADRWRAALAALAIPEEILAAAPESPWGFPPEPFRHRTERIVAMEASVLVERALEALPSGGTVLDVGVGGGATSLPLAARASLITGVDPSEQMLESFATTGERAGVATRSVRGSWPDVAADVPHADVVVCGHVLYNVADLVPFIEALTDHGRGRVVVEITATHPLSWMRDLWRRFHDLDRPAGPTANDAETVLREMGLDVEREDREIESRLGGFERQEDAIALVRRRLCLLPGRDLELAQALGERLVERDGLWSAGPQAPSHIATIWWTGTARPAGLTP